MAAPFAVESSVPGTPVWVVDGSGNTNQTGAVNCATINAVAYNITGTGTQGPALYTGIQTFAAGAGNNTQLEANGTVLSTLLIKAQETTGTQIGDTTRDYMCYVCCTVGGTNNTLCIGSATGGTSATIFANATMTIGSSASFRLPAQWYIFYNGTATLGLQYGIPC